MNNKLFYIIVSIILFVGIFIVFTKVVYAKSFNLFCLRKQNIIITLKNDTDVDAAKSKILEIPQIKIVSIKYRDKEWSKMVNKYYLPKIDNPFKNEFTVKTKKNANLTEIYDKLREIGFVEDIKYVSDTKCLSNNNN